ncbi:MAG: hypothetical protein ILP12_07540 [Lachnospiraceae bacterium]|nr:hypothetical protein [Lachnospiraceae bacterium]
MEKKRAKIIDISRATFLSVCVILLVILILSTVLTYVLPRGDFAVTAEGGTDYSVYIPRDDLGGIPLWKALLAPVLVLATGDGISVIMLTLFLLIVSGTFQVLLDSQGVLHLVRAAAGRLKERKTLLLLALALLFFCFGAFFGLFEEILPMVPLIVLLMLGLGYDGYTGFLVTIGAGAMGFAAGITNPFTVVLASGIIGVSVTDGILFRLLVFAAMYGLLVWFLLAHTARITAHPELSPTWEADREKRGSLDLSGGAENARRLQLGTVLILAAALAATLVFSLTESLRDYTVPALALVFLLGCLFFGAFGGWGMRRTLESFGRGVLSALPTVLFILLSCSVKYILVEGHILATVAHGINEAASGGSRWGIAFILLGIILVLELFISSSTAKALFVMGILSCLTIPLSKQLLVLIYLFGDGYTNLFFPTSPVLWIALSMIGMSYGKWLRKSAPLWAGIAVLTAALLSLAVALDPIL